LSSVSLPIGFDAMFYRRSECRNSQQRLRRRGHYDPITLAAVKYI
jgi:hypothetical protein